MPRFGPQAGSQYSQYRPIQRPASAGPHRSTLASSPGYGRPGHAAQPNARVYLHGAQGVALSPGYGRPGHAAQPNGRAQLQALQEQLAERDDTIRKLKAELSGNAQQLVLMNKRMTQLEASGAKPLAPPKRPSSHLRAETERALKEALVHALAVKDNVHFPRDKCDASTA